jgi:hypothetical protein
MPVKAVYNPRPGALRRLSAGCTGQSTNAKADGKEVMMKHSVSVSSVGGSVISGQ